MQAADRTWGAQLRAAGVSALACAALVLLFSLSPLLGARSAPARGPSEGTPLECAELGIGSEPSEESARGSYGGGTPSAALPSLPWCCSAAFELRSPLAVGARARLALAFGRATPVRGPPLPLPPA